VREAPANHAEEIRRLRSRLALTQTQLAALLGVSCVTVSRWETGHRRPSLLARQRLLRLVESFAGDGMSDEADRERARTAVTAPERRGRLRPCPTNLPVQLTSFVGRERELGEIRRLLESCRLVTLTGSAGCG
jgi:transcriptional regulator with XRE-family HTH domain